VWRMSTVGKRIAALRAEVGETQEQYAAKLHVKRATFANWETDRSAPDIDSLKLICARHGVSLDYVLGRTDARQHDKEDRPIPEADLDAILRQHDLWFDGKPITYAEKLAVVEAIRLLRRAMEASREEETPKPETEKS